MAIAVSIILALAAVAGIIFLVLRAKARRAGAPVLAPSARARAAAEGSSVAFPTAVDPGGSRRSTLNS